MGTDILYCIGFKLQLCLTYAIDIDVNPTTDFNTITVSLFAIVLFFIALFQSLLQKYHFITLIFIFLFIGYYVAM
jgi:hypothetical protein